MANDRPVFFSDELSFDGVPSHLFAFWKGIHVSYACAFCNKFKTRLDALLDGRRCLAHPGTIKTDHHFTCCGWSKDVMRRMAWCENGCTRTMCRVPSTAPYSPPFTAWPSILFDEGLIDASPAFLKDDRTGAIFIGTAREARLDLRYSWPMESESGSEVIAIPFRPLDVAIRDGIEMPFVEENIGRAAISAFAYARVVARRRVQLNVDAALSEAGSFEPFYLVPNYDATIDPYKSALFKSVYG
jgi:hypothetical protein